MLAILRRVMIAIDAWTKRLITKERITGMGAGALDPFAHANDLALTRMGDCDGKGTYVG